jgi:regulator of sirC expression with transglutaminase-like and TPR domain
MNAFDRIVSGLPARLVDAAFVYGSDIEPYLDVAQESAKLKCLCRRYVASLHVGSDVDRLARLNDYFFGQLEFSGATSDYYDPRNSYLHEVIDRRKGIPISLSVLYRQMARSAGIRLFGVNLPGHFLLARKLPTGQREYIDVFNWGQRLTWKDCSARVTQLHGPSVDLRESDLPPMSKRRILIRMLRNLKGIYSRGNLDLYVKTQERIVLLDPCEPRELRDLAIGYFHQSRARSAVRILEQLVRNYPQYAEDLVTREYLERSAQEAILVN